MMGVTCTFSQHWMERVKFERGKETSIPLLSISLPQIVLLTPQLQIQKGQGKTRCGEREDSLQPPLPGQKTENRPAPGAHAQPGGALKRERPAEVSGAPGRCREPGSSQRSRTFLAASVGSGAELGAARRRGHPLLNGFSGVLRGMRNGSPPS